MPCCGTENEADRKFAVTELEHTEWLVAQRRGGEAEAVLTEAREVFERLEAKPWLDRVEPIGRVAQAPA